MDTNHASVIQWHCQGLKDNFEEVQNLISGSNRHIICLQDSDSINLKGFSIYNQTSVDGRPVGGSSILVEKGIPHEVLSLNTSLQAVAVRVTLHCTITVCSIYIPPRCGVKQ